jgi:hypothetical protein
MKETISTACVVFNRVNTGMPYDRKLKLYSKNYLKKVVTYLEEEEEYEKCSLLIEYIKIRFNHELNYKNPIIQ